MFTGHLSGGPFVRNVVLQIPKIYAIRKPNLNPNSNLNPNPMKLDICFGG